MKRRMEKRSEGSDVHEVLFVRLKMSAANDDYKERETGPLGRWKIAVNSFYSLLNLGCRGWLNILMVKAGVSPPSPRASLFCCCCCSSPHWNSRCCWKTSISQPFLQIYWILSNLWCLLDFGCLVLIASQLFSHHFKCISVVLTFEKLLSIRKLNVADIIPPALRNNNPGDTLQKSK